MKMIAGAVALAALITGAMSRKQAEQAGNMHSVMTKAGLGTVDGNMRNTALEVYVERSATRPTPPNCHTTGELPRAPRSLSFCHKFNDNACCVPQVDDENADFFGKLTNLGLPCRIRGDIRSDPLAQFYCLNCDPHQPEYIRLGMNSIKNGTTEPATPYSYASANGLDGGDYNCDSDSATGAVQEEGPKAKGTLLVDVQWASNVFKTSPLLTGLDGRLAQCGLLVSAPCKGADGQEIEGRDRYTCGDDLVIPSNYAIVWNASAGACNGTRTSLCVPLINASLENFLNIPSLGTPLIAEKYYFKLVKNKVCNNSEAEAHLNPHCLRTAEQIKDCNISELNRADSTRTMTYRDWVCSKGLTPGYCNNSICKTNESQPNETEMAKLNHPCCCGKWSDEKAFSSASTFPPMFAITLTILAMCFSL